MKRYQMCSCEVSALHANPAIFTKHRYRNQVPSRNIHAEPFDDETLVKLEIFSQYARAWVPTFAHKRYSILMIDAFAGPGVDIQGRNGSPLLFLSAIREQRGRLLANRSSVKLVLNDITKSKVDELRSRITPMVENEEDLRRLVQLSFSSMDAIALLKNVLDNPDDNPVLVCIDQNGIRALSAEIIELLSRWSRLDLLMFCSSSYIGRFGDTPEFKGYIDYLDIESIRNQPSHMQHRELTRQIRSRFSDKHHLKFASFSIKKGGNTYGVIFGSHSYRGIEKFLDVAWNLNKTNGEANFDIDGDLDKVRQPDLFGARRTKKQLFEDDLLEKIRDRRLQTNLDVYPFTLESGFLPTHAKDALRDFKSNGNISFKGQPLVSWEKFRDNVSITYEVINGAK